jgi:aminoglycoside 2'-N-acetyltransferase I
MNRPEENPISFYVAPVAGLLGQQRQAIIDLCTAAYGEDFSDIFEALPGTVHVLGYHAGVLVSHAAWVTRWLQPSGLPPLRTAYVEAVATDPAHQDKGYASAVMRHLAGQLDDYDLYDLAGLSP